MNFFHSQDSEHFPRSTFTSLSLISAKPNSTNTEVANEFKAKASNIIAVNFSIELEFYYNEFDWGLIYRYWIDFQYFCLEKNR